MHWPEMQEPVRKHGPGSHVVKSGCDVQFWIGVSMGLVVVIWVNVAVFLAVIGVVMLVVVVGALVRDIAVGVVVVVIDGTTTDAV